MHVGRGHTLVCTHKQAAVKGCIIPKHTHLVDAFIHGEGLAPFGLHPPGLHLPPMMAALRRSATPGIRQEGRHFHDACVEVHQVMKTVVIGKRLQIGKHLWDQR